MTEQTADERTVLRKAYFTDVTDEQWALVDPLLPGGGLAMSTCARCRTPFCT